MGEERISQVKYFNAKLEETELDDNVCNPVLSNAPIKFLWLNCCFPSRLEQRKVLSADRLACIQIYKLEFNPKIKGSVIWLPFLALTVIEKDY